MMQRCLILVGVVFVSSTLLLVAHASTSAASGSGAAPQSPPVDPPALYVFTQVPPGSKMPGGGASAGLNGPGVSGAVLVLGWDVIEPAMGQYDWTAFDQWMTMAASAGKKIELSITTGYVGSSHTPSWLFQPAPGGGG